MRFIHGLFFREFVVDIFIAFGLEDLVDDLEADFIDLLGIRLPVGERVAIFGLDDFFDDFFVHGVFGLEIYKNEVIFCF